MAMTDLGRAAGRLTADPRVAGDAVRYALAVELMRTVAATLRFLALNPATWVSQRYAENERDMLRGVVERLETATARDLITSCPMCGGYSCEDGCPLESVRCLAEAHAELADAKPDTEATRQ
jgi:hypothetical protein